MELDDEQVRQVRNKLSFILLENERIDEHQREIVKLTHEIKEILNDSKDKNS
jgi:hypothetical protein